ncbi:MAG: Rieske (2Fe-2S) protein [Methylobacteriaceae bacterium]|nr:Rieske (2Fe-2S) protein [Methylobacteriaceae bacterium]
MSTDIGAAHDFAERQVRIVDVAQRQIGIVRWRGDFYALSNICSHQGGPLCRGVLSGRLGATAPGEIVLDDTVPLIACPWHGWEFDVRTGRAILDPTLRVRTYPVRVAAGRVILDLDRVGAENVLASEA